MIFKNGEKKEGRFEKNCFLGEFEG